ncbi:hypothetical protein KAR91_31425 [Candidatus Pacearchaeota archaeon]|nr:hypothetical protein [Candidatus Pacearchaeota archaeon]
MREAKIENKYIELRELKKGTFFKLTATAKKVFIKESYNKINKTFDCINFDDCNECILIKSNKKVFINFTF